MQKLSLQELQALSTEEAALYCNDIRSFLVDHVINSGGHLASNLGIVEISTALCRAFSLPEDKIIYDTGHQCYVHKILTGRSDAFPTLRSLGGISGFPRREESPYDPFGTGHSGTGISAAAGFAKANRLTGKKNWTVAVIGDGALTGGEVFEAINNISREDKLIIILNDNGMSISKSVGALKKRLNKMRTAGYYRAKTGVKGALEKIPLIGEPTARAMKTIKDLVKRSVLPENNLFEIFGLHYFGPADGNDLKTVEFLIEEAKRTDRPSIIHLCTKKGKGYLPAEQNPTAYHGVSPKNAKSVKKAAPSDDFSHAFGREMCAFAAKDPAVAAITAAMTDGVGLLEFAKKYPARLFDVGIAEEHAMTFAAALACEGIKPCFAVYSTFFQRCVDQLFHDAALQNLPVVVALDRAGVTGEDGATHHGVFDLPLVLPIPKVEVFAPASFDELHRAMESAFAAADHPTVIRYPKGGESRILTEEFPMEAEIEKKSYGDGKKCVIITFGRICEEAVCAAKEAAEQGIGVTIVRFFKLKGFDEALFEQIFTAPEIQNAASVLFAEEGIKKGSFSEGILTKLCERNLFPTARKKILAIDERFVPHGKAGELLSLCGLDRNGMIKEILESEKN